MVNPRALRPELVQQVHAAAVKLCGVLQQTAEAAVKLIEKEDGRRVELPISSKLFRIQVTVRLPPLSCGSVTGRIAAHRMSTLMPGPLRCFDSV
jgi:hypothetical protein